MEERKKPWGSTKREREYSIKERRKRNKRRVEKQRLGKRKKKEKEGKKKKSGRKKKEERKKEEKERMKGRETKREIWGRKRNKYKQINTHRSKFHHFLFLIMFYSF